MFAGAVSLLAAGSVLAAPVPLLWAKADTSSSAMTTDLEGCRMESKDVRVNVQSPAYYGQGGIGGALGAAIGSAILSAQEEGPARLAYIHRCMHARGYVHVDLKTDEIPPPAEIKTSEKRLAWAQSIYSRPDFAGRLAESLKPPVPPLTPAKEEPLVYAGLRFDPAALTVAKGLVAPEQTVLSGKVSHRRTAVVDNDISFGGNQYGKDRISKGAVFVQLVAPGEIAERQTYWCGPKHHPTLFGDDQSFTYCYATDVDGYIIATGLGRPWYPTGFLGGDHPFFGSEKDFVLSIRESDTDLAGPMDLALTVSNIRKTKVTLHARLTKDGQTQTVWTGEAPFDANGQAVLPFWDHRLVMTRSGDGVTAVFTADGDGRGWEAVSLP